MLVSASCACIYPSAASVEDKRREEAELKKIKQSTLHRIKVKLHYWLEKVKHCLYRCTSSKSMILSNDDHARPLL